MKALLGKKIGMTRIFTEDGEDVPVTVIDAGPCFVTQIKTEEQDGYNALQLGFGELKETRATKAKLGHLAKANVKPLKHLKEFRYDGKGDYSMGQELTVDQFVIGEFVNVSGVSKGKGFAGVMKRYNFAGGKQTHGDSTGRRTGSIGMASDPSRVFKGKKMPGRMGGDRVQVSYLTVVKTDAEKNLLYVKGSVPGAKNSIVEIVHQV
jgi:large subunit ribosomal protein L3